jgi:hypothetical protein
MVLAMDSYRQRQVQSISDLRVLTWKSTIHEYGGTFGMSIRKYYYATALLGLYHAAMRLDRD